MGNIALEPKLRDNNHKSNNRNDIGALAVMGRCDWGVIDTMSLTGAQERTKLHKELPIFSTFVDLFSLFGVSQERTPE